MDAIDLEVLSVRESEQIEWKENVADIDNVVSTLSAFANDLANLGGGYVICGAAERKDENGFPLLIRTGLTAQRLKEVEGQVLTRCRDRVYPSITPLVQELVIEGSANRILVFIQPATGVAHTFRTDEAAKHYVRISRETREARNGVLRSLLVRKGALEPWDRRQCEGATVNDLDLLALRDTLQRMKVFSSITGIEPYLSDENQLSAFVPPLLKREPLTNVLRPRNFAIILFGRDPQRFIPGSYSLFSIYPGRDKSDVYAERHDLPGTIIEQARRLAELLDVQSYTAFDKSNTHTPNALKYPRRALYEAMGNALSHRDYEQSDPTRVTVFENRIEVLSPGSLPLGVDPDAFKSGQAGPRWRNQALAWFFNRLQIAQAEGQGIPTILRTMHEEGNPPPVLETTEVSVTCILPAHPRHALLREFRDIEQALSLGKLGVAQAGVLRILETDHLNHRALQLFGEVQMALHDPELVADVLNSPEMRLERLPPAVLLQLSEALDLRDRNDNRFRDLSTRLLKFAAQGRLEERELRRICVGLIKNREWQAVIDLIDSSFKGREELKANASISQLVGDAYLGLAKRCSFTATRPGLATATRDRIWKDFDLYITKAEAELVNAQGVSEDPGLNKVIRRNLVYLQELKRKKPRPRRR